MDLYRFLHELMNGVVHGPLRDTKPTVYRGRIFSPVASELNHHLGRQFCITAEFKPGSLALALVARPVAQGG
jgi:hypothetical protein